MGKRVFISIGSNLGDRVSNCRTAVRLLGAEDEVDVVRESSLYETEPWGMTAQPSFVNSVVEVSTGLSPRELLKVLKAIERRMGRVPGPRWGERVIDLDIVFYGDSVVEEEGLSIPHPHAHERAFVLAPLEEIAPEFVHPVLKVKVSELLSSLGADNGARKIRPSGKSGNQP